MRKLRVGDQVATALLPWAAGNIPVQSVAPMPLPVTLVRDWDRQCQQRFDQMVAKWQSSPLDEEQHKQARTLPQLDPKDSPLREHALRKGRKDHDRGCSRTRDSADRQAELDKACGKSRARNRVHSRARSKSCKQSKSQKHSKSQRRSKSRGCGGHEVCKPGVWSYSRHAAQAKDTLRRTGPTN